MTTNINDQMVLIGGESGTGKSMSLANLKNQERVLYLNCEAGKRLPFKNKFLSKTITEPHQVYEAFDYVNGNKDYDTVVVDTITFLLDMYESQYIAGVPDGRAAWGEFAQYFKKLMQDYAAKSDKSVIFLAHTLTWYDEKSMQMKTSVPVKGALKNNGIEAYFSTVVSTKKVELTKLEPYHSDLLNITDTDKMLGYKHVFQTQLTKETVGDRIRSPIGMFSTAQTYIDNDAQLLLDHLKDYYS